MSAPTLTLPLPGLPIAPLKKKRVLLVDTSRTKRDLRSETMRKLGAEVDCAADISEARCWWRADLYDLVLINVEDAVGPRDRFCDDLRNATPPQQIMFLVGKPGYLATSPNLDPDRDPRSREHEDDPGPAMWSDVKTALATSLSEPLPQRWGILEACRRISAVRSVSDARSKAIRNRPAPPRDSEISASRRLDEVEIPAELIMEKAQ